MSHDPKQKISKTFQCRKYLWEIFEELSHELDCDTDFLLNEAMRLYAKTRADECEKAKEILSPPWDSSNLQELVESDQHAESGIDDHEQDNKTLTPPSSDKKNAELEEEENQASLENLPEQEGASEKADASDTSPDDASSNPQEKSDQSFSDTGSTPTPSNAKVPYTEMTTSKGGEEPSLVDVVPPRTTTPPPLPADSEELEQKESASPADQKELFLHFEDQKVKVDKDEFIIGRSARNADFAIRDANISRRHAAIVLKNGVYKIKDLGSTNGVEFQGSRIKEKEISDGETYKLCNFEIQFTLK